MRPRWTSLVPAMAVLAALGAGACAAEEPREGAAGDLKGAVGEFEPPVRLKAGEELIDTAAHVGHAGPLVVDLDENGLPDLLVGNFRGHFQVYMNTGNRAAPEYADKGLLEAGGKTAEVPNW
jgi:hypothetical protein